MPTAGPKFTHWPRHGIFVKLCSNSWAWPYYKALTASVSNRFKMQTDFVDCHGQWWLLVTPTHALQSTAVAFPGATPRPSSSIPWTYHLQAPFWALTWLGWDAWSCEHGNGCACQSHCTRGWLSQLRSRFLTLSPCSPFNDHHYFPKYKLLLMTSVISSMMGQQMMHWWDRTKPGNRSFEPS